MAAPVGNITIQFRGKCVQCLDTRGMVNAQKRQWECSISHMLLQMKSVILIGRAVERKFVIVECRLDK